MMRPCHAWDRPEGGPLSRAGEVTATCIALGGNLSPSTSFGGSVGCLGSDPRGITTTTVSVGATDTLTNIVRLQPSEGTGSVNKHFLLAFEPYLMTCIPTLRPA